jgi:hypothetical protein
VAADGQPRAIDQHPLVQLVNRRRQVVAQVVDVVVVHLARAPTIGAGSR